MSISACYDKHVQAWDSFFPPRISAPVDSGSCCCPPYSAAMCCAILENPPPHHPRFTSCVDDACCSPLSPGCPPDTSWWLRESPNKPFEQRWSHLLSLLSLPSHPGTRLYRQRDMRNVTPREVISLVWWRLWHCCAPLSGASTKRAFAIYNNVLLKFLTEVPWC